jgi:hypothetical protein
MFVRIRTYDFDLNGADWHPARHYGPGIARELKWINGVRNHGAAEAEVVLRDRVADAIARIIKRLADSRGLLDTDQLGNLAVVYPFVISYAAKDKYDTAPQA